MHTRRNEPFVHVAWCPLREATAPPDMVGVVANMQSPSPAINQNAWQSPAPAAADSCLCVYLLIRDFMSRVHCKLSAESQQCRTATVCRNEFQKVIINIFFNWHAHHVSICKWQYPKTYTGHLSKHRSWSGREDIQEEHKGSRFAQHRIEFSMYFTSGFVYPVRLPSIVQRLIQHYQEITLI